MKIIFLDIQGVLYINAYKRSLEQKGLNAFDIYGPKFSPPCVQNLEKLIEATQAKIVMSSSWRIMGWERATALWQDRQLPGELISLTGQFPELNRGGEIYKWLQENGYHNEPPTITQYVIIDDNNTMLQSQQNNFVQTNTHEGFTQTNLQQALDILNRPHPNQKTANSNTDPPK